MDQVLDSGQQCSTERSGGDKPGNKNKRQNRSVLFRHRFGNHAFKACCTSPRTVRLPLRPRGTCTTLAPDVRALAAAGGPNTHDLAYTVRHSQRRVRAAAPYLPHRRYSGRNLAMRGSSCAVLSVDQRPDASGASAFGKQWTNMRVWSLGSIRCAERERGWAAFFHTGNASWVRGSVTDTGDDEDELSRQRKTEIQEVSRRAPASRPVVL